MSNQFDWSVGRKDRIPQAMLSLLSSRKNSIAKKKQATAGELVLGIGCLEIKLTSNTRLILFGRHSGRGRTGDLPRSGRRDDHRISRGCICDTLSRSGVRSNFGRFNRQITF